MSVVFFHIPRTGGSSIWHSLARLAETYEIPAYDLYDHSRKLTGSPYHAIEALVDIAGEHRPAHVPGVFHHHTRQNITGILSPQEHHYVTIIRDPVDRLVSEITYLRSLIGRIPKTSAEFTYLERLLSPSLIAALFDPLVSIDDLLLRAACEPFYRNYYVNSFWQLLFGDTGPQAPIYEKMPEAVIPALADVVNRRFLVINRFPDITQTFAAIVELMGLADAGSILPVANGAPYTRLADDTVRTLREVNAAEYRFTELVSNRALGPQRAAATPQGASHSFMEAHRAASAARADMLAAQIKAMRDSRSWRITKPLRRIRGIWG